MDTLRQHTTQWLLALILIAAALLRTHDLNWDDGQHTHPDERWIAMVAPTIAWPENPADLLDPRRSTLNPLWTPDGAGGGEVRNFAYGHLPLYLHALAGHAIAGLGERLADLGPAYQSFAAELRAYGDYRGITLVGRLFSVLADLGIVYLVYLLGRRIYDDRTALLAAALVALAVTHVQLAHFATFDTLTAFFITLSVYGSVCIVQSPQPLWATMGAGAAAGLAVASKFSAAPLVAVLILAHVIRAMRAKRPVRDTWPYLLLGLSAAGLVFFLTSPFALLDWRLYLKQIMEQGAMVRGQVDWPFTRQYRYTTPFVYQVVQQVRWGLGWVLGPVAFAGFGWTVARQFRRPRAEELVMLGWAVPYFLLTGSFMVKFMRYMLPLLPLIILMGAAMLWQLVRWAQQRMRLARLLSAAPYAVLAASAVWALSFGSVYSQEHPWIQASRWIYDHVPAGAALAVEHWDDHLPLSLPGEGTNPYARSYRHLELPMYEPDSYDKLILLWEQLRAADYIVLSTNRLYRTIPRLPERYPYSSEFYRLLFEEKLGYVRAAEFTAYPGLLGLHIPDDDADESFTVYDHPRPIVFRKERELEEGEWFGLFSDVLDQRPVWEFQKRGLAAQLQRQPPEEGEEAKTLLLDRPVGDLPVVDDFGWNRWASDSTVAATLLWWLATLVLGWLAWPISFCLFSGLRDRGYMFTRALSLVVVGYLIWLPASLRWLQNGLPLTLGAIALLGLASAILWWRYRGQMRAWLRERRGVVVLGEAVFGLSYLAFVGIRILNPDLWQPWLGGEKLMDIAYLNATMRSAYMPPYDPYFAHGYLNYYYYGQFLVSILVRLTGLRTEVAFNLAVPTLFALTVSGAFSIGYSLAGRILDRGPRRAQGTWFGVAHGLLSALCVTVFGNLASATQIVERLGQVGASDFASQIPGLQGLVRAAVGLFAVLVRGAHYPGFNYWDPSRVVGPTINEFPYWSFLFADLHPHMMNIPFTLLVLGFALNAVLRSPAPARAIPDGGIPAADERSLLLTSIRYLWQRIDWSEVLNWLLWPLALGALWAINSWDWPAYAGFSGLALLMAWVRRYGQDGSRRWWSAVLPALAVAVLLAASGLILYLPFIRHYAAIYVGFGLGLVRGDTLLSEFLTVWGFFLFLAVTLLLVLAGRARQGLVRMLGFGWRRLTRLQRAEQLSQILVRAPGRGERLRLLGLIVLLAATILVAWLGFWTLALMLPLLALAGALLIQPDISRERRFVVALVFTAFLLLVGVEIFYLKDHLDGGDAWRMNTLFKFYLQVWIMLGVAVGAALPGLWRAAERWRPFWRHTWTVALALLLIAVSLFVALGTPARVLDRFPGARPALGTLDGLAFMEVGSYTWPNDENRIQLWGDYQAIRWLNENVPGTPVIAEAPLPYYREFGGRVSSYTGLPTPYNDQHQREQRYGWQVGPRSHIIELFFRSSNVEETLDIARELHIAYVYLGPLERVHYDLYLAKFEGMAERGYLEVVYQNELVTIYRFTEAISGS